MIKRIESGISGRMLRRDLLLWFGKIATSLHLKGAISTKNDGSIKIMAEGEEGNLIEFINRVKENTSFHVENFYVNWSDPQEQLESFYILEN